MWKKFHLEKIYILYGETVSETKQRQMLEQVGSSVKKETIYLLKKKTIQKL